jgi:mannan endo-1,4-beta-mannosidase
MADPMSINVASGAASGRGLGRRILLGIPSLTGTPVQTDFSTFNALIAPRNIDVMLFFQSLDTEPPFYSSGSSNYPAWADSLGTIIMSTFSSSTHAANYYTSGVDTTGLYNNTGLQGLATIAASLDQPMIIRLFHEFNLPGNSYGYTHETAAQFVAAWQHIVTVFRNAGATNVLWCWCPNVWSANASNAVDPTAVDGSGVNWYPGDAYVDIIGLDGYNFISSPAVLSPAALFLDDYNAVCGISPRPFAICEVGNSTQPTRPSLVALGGRAGWFSLLFQMIQDDMPRCIMVNTWQRNNTPDDFTIGSSGGNSGEVADAAAAAAFIAGVTSPPFTTAGALPAINWLADTLG